MNKYIQLAVLAVLAVVALFLIPRKNQEPAVNVTNFSQCQQAGGILTDGDPVICSINGKDYEAEEGLLQADVIVDTPQPGDLVTSPLQVKGRAKGYWYFEANLPVTLKDQNGNVLAQKGFQAQGEWMTEDYVEFDEVLTFTQPTTQFGALIIEKDNPSGLPQFDASFAVPLLFQ